MCMGRVAVCQFRVAKCAAVFQTGFEAPARVTVQLASAMMTLDCGTPANKPGSYSDYSQPSQHAVHRPHIHHDRHRAQTGRSKLGK
jgi:hypothetical protein